MSVARIRFVLLDYIRIVIAFPKPERHLSIKDAHNNLESEIIIVMIFVSSVNGEETNAILSNACSFLISRNIAIYLRKLIKVASRLIKFHLIGQRRATYAVTRIFQMPFAQNLMDQLTSHATLLNYGEFFS